MEFADGTIQSANLPTPGNKAKVIDTRIYRAMIMGFAYADDVTANSSAKAKTAEVQYNVVVLGGYRGGQFITNVRMSKLLGGQFNYHAQRLGKTTKPAGTPLKDHDGDIVYIQFIQGDTDYPVIVGYGVNNQDDNKSSIKKADGPVYRWQYNGVFEQIDKNGNYNLQIKGGKYDQAKDSFTPATSPAIDVVFNPTDETYTRTFTSGLTIVEDAKNQKFKVTAGSTFLEIDGKSGKIKLSSAEIDLGASTSDFVTMFTDLCSQFNKHTHQYNPGPGTPAPTTPPLAPLLSTAGSQTVKVQP